MGTAARERVVTCWSVDVMVAGYERLITSVYERKTGVRITTPSEGEAALGDEMVEEPLAAGVGSGRCG